MRARTDEAGAVIALYAFAIVAMFLMAALVIDLGQLRADRRTNKAVADVAARAGVGRLQLGPWSGVCKAREYLLVNARQFGAFDAGSERWSNAAEPASAATSNPCPATLSAADAVPCAPGNPSTWARMRATAGGGRFTIEIQSGYALPDARFPEDGTQRADTGAPDQGSCDNLAVIITQRRGPFFAQVAGFGETTTRVRSVARLNATENVDFTPALHLLERHKCGVLQTGGTNTRVIAQPYGRQPGVIQIDSAADTASCPQPILNGQATSTGPSIVACSTASSRSECQRGTGDRKARVGIYALNFARPPGYIASAFPTTYGETKAVATPRTGRRFVDRRYLSNVRALEDDARTVLTGNGGRPPGCSTVVSNGCTGNGVQWLVVQPADCTNLATFFSVPGRTAARHIWFDCDLGVSSELALTAANSFVAVTGSLSVASGTTFTIADPRNIYIGGRTTGNLVGLDPGNGVLRVNTGTPAVSRCQDRTGPGRTTKLVLASGSFRMGSGARAMLCQTFVYMASGYGKLPAAQGTAPCGTPCATFNGTVDVGSGSFMDWSAPNEITGRLPTPEELVTTSRFEDLAFWTEAGGNTNGINGGAATSLTGVFFLPNADSFNLAGGGSLPIYLSAQFISSTLRVSGGASVNLVPNPEDSVPVAIYSTLLVR